MAQTSSAQREPSMEEILASIRRIIEDSDTVRTPAEDAVAAGADAAEPVESNTGPDVDAFRAGLADAPATPAPLSMAEIQADVAVPQAQRSAPERSAEVHPLRDRFAPASGETAETPDAPRTAMPAEDEPVEETVVEETPAEQVAVTEEPEVARPESSPFALRDEQPEAVAAAEAPRPETKSSIISEVTGRQVAAAFGELSDAFASSRRRSFDEIAEEMLRPMLQDWLDNNLPTLVERLVREEIERVARGGGG